jgi:Tol biopolymer transport system component
MCLVLSLTACASEGSGQATDPSSTEGPSTTAEAAQTTPAPVTTTSVSEDSPVVDEGDWVVFQWVADGGSDGIFLIRPDGTGRHQLLPEMSGSEWHPDWSPDGSRIAFIHLTPEDRTELWVVNADGTGEEMLYRCDLPCNELGYPDWSPDGTLIYYGQSSNPGPEGIPATFEVGRYDLASRETSVVLTRDDGASAEQPRISPDGSRVAYTRLRETPAPGGAIFVSDLLDGPERQLTEWEGGGMHPDWTPDGKIVFDTFDIMVFQEIGFPANLFVMNDDGSDLQPITLFEGDPRASQPRVAPDGSGVVYTHLEGPGPGTRRMALIGLDGKGQRLLTPEPVDATHSQLRPVP